MEIRFCTVPISVNTFNVLYSLDQKYIDGSWTKKAWMSLNQETTYKLYILQNSDNIEGFALLYFLEGESVAHLLKIVISPIKRGQGAASRLLTFSFDDLIQKYHIRSIYLEVDSQNSNAVKLYSSMKFKTVNRLKGFYSSGKDALVMIKNL